MLSPLSRRLRTAAAAAVLGLTLAGTAVGQDDHFPFGPFRMFSTKTPRDGIVKVSLVRAVTVDGRDVRVPMGSFGLRRAEFEGQLDRFAVDPSLLGSLVVARERAAPDAPRLREVTLLKARWVLSDGRRVGYVEEPVAIWRRP
ncbi:MAG TPA: hypothetical protein VNB94_00200 [Mycobacteriales bacterium]|nr:hypothetical protein [Mycobacteriales bacterium]